MMIGHSFSREEVQDLKEGGLPISEVSGSHPSEAEGLPPARTPKFPSRKKSEIPDGRGSCATSNT